MEVLDDTFERPHDAATMSIAKRELTRVTGYVPHVGRWALEKWAERVVVRREDDTGVEFAAHVLPPVTWRCAIMMLMAGPEAFLHDAELNRETSALAARLLGHHGLSLPDTATA